jgi:hypothetical protein
VVQVARLVQVAHWVGQFAQMLLLLNILAGHRVTQALTSSTLPDTQ